MFKGTIALFDEYYRKMEAEQPGFNRDLAMEVRERLEQLDYIVERARDLEHQVGLPRRKFMESYEAEQKAAVEHCREPSMAAINIDITEDEKQQMSKASFELQLFTETFYYFAFRTRQILQNPKAGVLGLSGFECKGVRDVRNKLIEHVEGKDSQIFIRSFASGGLGGPIIKGPRYDGQHHFQDAGLYTNAEEFRDDLDRVLNNSLKSGLS